MKVICITHTDMDGSASVAGIQNMYQYSGLSEMVEHIYCEAYAVDEMVDKIIDENTDATGKINIIALYITDLSVSYNKAQMLDDLIKANKLNAVLIDHHKTAERLNDFKWCFVDTAYSAAVNVARYSATAKELNLNYIDIDADKIELLDFNPLLAGAETLKAVSDYDTGNWGDWDTDMEPKDFPAPIILNTAYKTLGRNKFEQYMERAFTYNISPVAGYKQPLGEFLSGSRIGGCDVVEIHCSEVYNSIKELQRGYDSFAKSVKVMPHDNPISNDHKVGFTVCGTGVPYSMYSKKYLEDPANVSDIIAALFVDDFSVSLRTARDDIDVSMIAKYYGGGGHPKAAGFKTSMTTVNLQTTNGDIITFDTTPKISATPKVTPPATKGGTITMKPETVIEVSNGKTR